MCDGAGTTQDAGVAAEDVDPAVDAGSAPRPYCSGEVDACGAFNEFFCDEQAGCYVSGERCRGTPDPCGTFDLAYTCRKQQGCYWVDDEGCGAPVNLCDVHEWFYAQCGWYLSYESKDICLNEEFHERVLVNGFRVVSGAVECVVPDYEITCGLDDRLEPEWGLDMRSLTDEERSAFFACREQ